MIEYTETNDVDVFTTRTYREYYCDVYDKMESICRYIERSRGNKDIVRDNNDEITLKGFFTVYDSKTMTNSLVAYDLITVNHDEIFIMHNMKSNAGINILRFAVSEVIGLNYLISPNGHTNIVTRLNCDDIITEIDDMYHEVSIRTAHE